jgi:hypothetical protein
VELVKSPDGTPLDLARALDFKPFVQQLGDYRLVRYADDDKPASNSRTSPARRQLQPADGASTALRVVARSVASINEPREYLNRSASVEAVGDGLKTSPKRRKSKEVAIVLVLCCVCVCGWF